MYLLLDAPFLFAVQIIVYAGAIMVLFLFVIMLLGVDRTEDVRRASAVRACERWRGSSLGIGFVAGDLLRRCVRGSGSRARGRRRGSKRDEQAPANTQALAKRACSPTYFFPFEVTSILLIIAAIAAMVLAQRKAPAITQAEMDARVADPEPVPTGSEATA